MLDDLTKPSEVGGGLIRADLRQPDGRLVSLYGSYSAPPAGYRAPKRLDGAYERRWNPLRSEWVLVAASRQGRTFLPAPDACPLCPSSERNSSEIPASNFEVAVFENRFPAMRGDGVCEVVVYTAQHHGAFASLDQSQLERLLEVWRDRYEILGARPDVNYVYIFENRGEAVGVTLQHPHGQIYAYPFIPPVVETELKAGRAHTRENGGCLQCYLIRTEVDSGERVLFAEDGIAAYVPEYARWPYEVHVAPVAHAGALPDLTAPDRAVLGRTMQRVTRAYDRLFDLPMPYMMAMHQRPTDDRPHPEAHLHVEFYPVLRMPGRLKYLAGGECGAGVFVSDGLPEEKAAELRKVL